MLFFNENSLIRTLPVVSIQDSNFLTGISEIVTAVAEGVPFPDGACQGSGAADGVAPGVILIPYHFRAVFVNQGDDVVLGVPDKQRSPAIRFAACCYTRPHCGPVYVPVAAGRIIILHLQPA